VEERVDEWIKHVEPLPRMPRGTLWLAQTSACITRADRARELPEKPERESVVDKVGHVAQIDWLLGFLSS